MSVDALLKIGDKVGTTQRTVLEATKTHERVPGDSYACWTAICYEAGALHEYVVWQVIARPEGFVASSGNYYKNFEEAYEDYKLRGGK